MRRTGRGRAMMIMSKPRLVPVSFSIHFGGMVVVVYLRELFIVSILL